MVTLLFANISLYFEITLFFHEIKIYYDTSFLLEVKDKIAGLNISVNIVQIMYVLKSQDDLDRILTNFL